VHGPFTPAERHKDLYADRTITRPESAVDSLEGKPALQRQVPGVPAKKKAAAKKKAGARPGEGGELVRNQLRCLKSIDEGVGRIFQVLADQGQLDKTLLIFTSDNGYFWGEHGLGDKRWAYEESIRIPLLMRLPGLIKPGSTIEAMVLNIDIAPTLLDLAGASLPSTLQGRSLVPLLRGDKTDWRTSFLAEYFQEPGYPRTPTWQAIRTGRWKYIHYTDLEGMDELYDLQADPHELKNRIADPATRETLETLKAELRERLEETR
ncbi:MAG: sulfatase-like hydrolase/transferase, partial [Isosphaeraceae bacterium]|nr:sulfatase-like hydrolase/transferase [Isosphaeraceae bacterium]